MPPSLHGTWAWVRTRKPRASSRADRLRQQQQVLEHPAGQGHAVQPAPIADGHTGLLDQPGHPVVETGRDDRGRYAARQVTGRGADQVGPRHLERFAGGQARAVGVSFKRIG